MAGSNPDLVVRVAANISALQADMATAATSIKTIESAVTSTSAAMRENAMGATELRDALMLAFDHPMYALRDLTKAIGVDMVGALGAGTVEAGVAGAAIIGAFAVMGETLKTLTEDAAEVGAGIYDASLKMSASVPGVSQLKFAAEVAGGSLEQVSSAVFMMQERLGKSPDAFEKGLTQIGMSLQDIRDLAPDERFIAIASALRQSGDETNKQAVAMELFGRQGRELLPLIMKPLDELIEKSKELGFTWTDADARAADELTIKTRELDAEWTKLKTDVGVELIPAMTFLADNLKQIASDFIKGADGGVAFDVVMLGLEGNIAAVTAAIDVFAGRVEHLPKVSGDAAKGVRDWHTSIKDLALYVPTLDDALAATAEIIRDLDPITKKQIENADRFAAVLAEVNSAGIGWRGTLDTIDGSLIDNMRDLTAAGVSLKTLETYYGLTATQGKAFTDMLKDETDTLKSVEAQQIELQKVTDEYYKAVNAAGHDTVQRQIDDAYLAADARIAAMTKAKNYSVEAEMMIWETADQTANNIVQKTLEADVHSKAHYEKVADDARIAYERARDSVGQFTADYIQHLRDGADAARLSADAFGTGFEQNATKVTAAFAGATQAAGVFMSTIKGMVDDPALVGYFGNSGQGSVARTLYGGGQTGLTADEAAFMAGGGFINTTVGGHRAGGGPVSPGVAYPVGELGPELFVPQSAGSIVPNAGGTTIVNHIYITQPLGTPTAIAKLVDEALMARQRNTGQRT